MLRTILALSLLFAWNAHSSETFSGTAFRIFVDWEKPTRAPSLYHFVRLNSSEGQKQQFLPLLGAGDEILEIPVGAELKLTGTRVGSYFLMENYQVAQKSPTFNDVCPSKLGAQKTATLTVGGSSSRLPSGFQTKRVEETFFGEGDQSLNNYLKKTTFEKSWIEGHHYTSTQANGVFKLEKNYPIRRSTFEEDITKLLEASIKIADPSIDYTQYGRLIHIIPKLPSGVLGVGTLDCIADVETEDGKVDLSVFWAPYFVFRSAINLSLIHI